MKIKILGVLLVLVVGVVAWVASNPLRRSEETIRARIRSLTPLGATKESVITVLRENGWIDTRYIGSSGFLKQAPGCPIEVVGVTSLRGEIGDYRAFPVPFVTSVTVFWGFDADARLMDIWVWKTTDAL